MGMTPGLTYPRLLFNSAGAVIGIVGPDGSPIPVSGATGAFTELSATGDLTVGGDLVLSGTLSFTGELSYDSSFTLSAVAASLPTLAFVDACFHLAKNDTDKGAWRKRKGQSWRSEARSAGSYLGSYATATAAVAAGGATGDVFYNTTASAFHEITGATTSSVTYRAGREDYPTNALITAEAARVIIWDLDGAVPSMWMVFTGGNAGYYVRSGGSSAICVKDSTIVVGRTTADTSITVINFVSDNGNVRGTGGRYAYSLPISGRNAVSTFTQTSLTGIVDATVNDVAITILPDAPLDEYGMTVPTIFVATNAGISVINNNGTVADLVDVAGDDTNEVVFDRNNNCYFTNETQGDLDMFLASNYDADDTTPDATYDNTTVPALLAAITATKQGLVATKDAIVAGHSTGLSVLLPSTASKANGMVSYITSAFNSGFMVGDIRRAFLANSKTADRSIKAATLTEVGTITETTYTGGRSVYSGFSASNYLQEASHADWNALGTGDFSIVMSGVKWGTAGTARALVALGDAITTTGSFVLQLDSSGYLIAYVYDGTATRIFCASSPSVFTDTAEHTVEFSRSGTTTSIKIDGVVISSTTGGYAATSISNATDPLTIGARVGGLYPWTGGKCSCVRISATTPSAEQSKFIAATENALNGGNACLLSNSSTVSALSYDADTDTYLVGNGTNVDTFNGLKRVASQAHGVTTLTSLASANGRKLIAGTGASYSAPERNVSAELLEAQTTKPRTQNYSFTSSGTTWALPKGWKAQGVIFNLTDGTMAAAAQTFDGFLWTLSGLTTAKAHQIQLVEA